MLLIGPFIVCLRHDLSLFPILLRRVYDCTKSYNILNWDGEFDGYSLDVPYLSVRNIYLYYMRDFALCVRTMSPRSPQ